MCYWRFRCKLVILVYYNTLVVITQFSMFRNRIEIEWVASSLELLYSDIWWSLVERNFSSHLSNLNQHTLKNMKQISFVFSRVVYFCTDFTKCENSCIPRWFKFDTWSLITRININSHWECSKNSIWDMSISMRTNLQSQVLASPLVFKFFSNIIHFKLLVLQVRLLHYSCSFIYNFRKIKVFSSIII